MKVFLCWSGRVSKGVATALKEWLGDVIQGLHPFMSNESIRKGDRWRTEIAQNLAETNYGILCLTSDNLTSPWILFEAGALSKNLKDSRVTALLIGIDTTQVVEPLSQFQHTTATREEILILAKQLNDLLPQPLEAERLERSFEAHWPRLEGQINRALALPLVDDEPPKRSTDDMIEEILRLTREIKKQSEPSLARALLAAKRRKTVSGFVEDLKPEEATYTGPLKYVVHNVLLLANEHSTRTGSPPTSQDTDQLVLDVLPLLPIGSTT